MKRGAKSSAYQRLKKHRFVSKEGSSDESDSNSSDGLDDQNPSSKSSLNQQPSLLEERENENRELLNTPDTEDSNLLSLNESAEENLERDSEPNLASDTEPNLASDSSESNLSSDSENEYYSNDSSTFSEADSLDYDYDEVYEVRSSHNPVDDLKQGLRSWSIRNNITLKALSELLRFLRTWLMVHCIFLGQWISGFPLQARTLLGTNRDTNTKRRKMESQTAGKFGDFAYFGLKRTLEQIVHERYFPNPTICLSFNADGLPLYRSSSTNFWPILCKIYDTVYQWKPFPVAVYCGPGKPKFIEDFLDEFVTEISNLLDHGIEIAGRHYAVKLYCFICDTPARALLKCIVEHGGFFCCERCTVKGATVNKRRVYPETGCELRTDESFLNKLQKEHHSGTSPLTRIPGFKPVTSFILDSMHLFYLGIMKRLLAVYWIGTSGKKTVATIVASQSSRLSKRLEVIRRFIPREFPRKVRGLAELPRFKATEFRFFLLYCGPVVLRNILTAPYHKHFLLFHVASRIMCSSEWCNTLQSYAKELCKHFFDFLPDLYGADSQITNMHNLLHVADDVKNFGISLDDLSAFDFENELGKMKSVLRSPNKPLEQYCRRRNEWGPPPPPKKKVTLTPVIRRSTRDKISVIYLDFTLTAEQPDNFVLLQSGAIVEISTIEIGSNKDVVLHGREWKDKFNIFEYPCPSSRLLEWEIQRRSDSSSSWKLEEVKAKMIYMTVSEGGSDKHFAIAVLHSVH